MIGTRIVGGIFGTRGTGANQDFVSKRERFYIWLDLRETFKKYSRQMKQTYTSLGNSEPINCQKNDGKDPPRGRRRRRGSIRISSHGSVRGMATAMASATSPAITLKPSLKPGMRKRRKSTDRGGMSTALDMQNLTTLMGFMANNRAERVTLLQIAMTPFEVCYRSHNSLVAGWAWYRVLEYIVIYHAYLQDRKQNEKDALCDFIHKRLKGAWSKKITRRRHAFQQQQQQQQQQNRVLKI